jgi:hypothetical protein
MNSFDPFLQLTVFEMQEIKLIYLDTKIIEKNDTLELEQYRKNTNDTTCIMNNKQAVAPLQYKKSCLSGEIYRVYNCTSNIDTLKIALKTLRKFSFLTTILKIS